MHLLRFVLFTVSWLVALYLGDSLIAGHFKRIEFRKAVLYFSTVAMIGLFGEIFLDTSYNFSRLYT